MAIKDLVVHITDGPDCAARLTLAVTLARIHGAHLAGVYVEPPLPMSAYPEIPVPAAIIDAEIAAIAACAAEQAARFNAATAQATIGSEWRQTRADNVTALNVSARYADLVILGQAPSRSMSWFDPAIAEHVALACGRPLLVVPHDYVPAPLGQRILIAWNGGREAVRAVHDALPLLAQAEFVQVMVTNPVIGYGDHGAEPGADICRHLAHHGVRAEAHVGHAEHAAVGALLLAQAAAIGADLIVMGAYGHSRMRELVLGGVTRHLLRHMTIPLFVAH